MESNRTRPARHGRYAWTLVLCCGALLPAGVAARPEERVAPVSQPGGAAQDRPAAVLDSSAIGWPEVAPLLAEAAGALVLEEVLLSRVLEDEIRARGLTVAADRIEAERTLLIEMLAETSRTPAAEAERLLTGVRAARGLGDLRFAALLKRNAQLRALVNAEAGQGGLSVSAEDVEQAIAIKHGPKARTRLILVRTEEQAARAIARLDAGAPFAEVAAEFSADSSRLRGGLLDPLSTADPAYPVAFRRAIEQTPTGRHSGAVLVPWDNAPGYVVLQVEERIAAEDVDRAAVAPVVEREVRTVRERALMDRLARDLINNAASRLSVLDPSLEWSWRNRRASP